MVPMGFRILNERVKSFKRDSKAFKRDSKSFKRHIHDTTMRLDSDSLQTP